MKPFVQSLKQWFRRLFTRRNPPSPYILMINVARDFSKYPGGRFYSDGPFSGERFREEFLVPALKTGFAVHVILDGTLGYGASFLEEAFGGAVRLHAVDCRNLTLIGENDVVKAIINGYIHDALCGDSLTNRPECGETLTILPKR